MCMCIKDKGNVLQLSRWMTFGKIRVTARKLWASIGRKRIGVCSPTNLSPFKWELPRPGPKRAEIEEPKKRTKIKENEMLLTGKSMCGAKHANKNFTPCSPGKYPLKAQGQPAVRSKRKQMPQGVPGCKDKEREGERERAESALGIVEC